MLDPIEPPKVDESKMLGEMQSGALSVADKEARGAQLLRQLDISHFRDCLKRSYLDGPGANIARADHGGGSPPSKFGTSGSWGKEFQGALRETGAYVYLVVQGQGGIREQCLCS